MMNTENMPPLITLAHLRKIVGPDILGRDKGLQLMQQHGFRLGRRYVLPRTKLEALLRGALPEQDNKNLDLRSLPLHR
ncbi:hypothetical protein Mrose_01186 [Calidithermus roseus]|uniref:Uncharacterized protein n=2 Tax=Calidithermus roseus TaxID=1644118 RepID=A0A399EZN4_9DEIN|nr:hypothetical protein Mrose_01186 [Calidithermus roseus]